jgi:chorismate-pyruvate lyase
MDLPVLTCPKFLSLLNEFYARRPAPPPIEAVLVTPEQMPQPQRRLLVHDRDMTSTLEEHHGEPLALRVLDRRVEDDIYARHIVLHTAQTQRPAEYGALRVHLPLLDEPVRGAVFQARQPLGAILNAHGGAYRGCPGAFFRIFSNDLINDSLQLGRSQWLYGRCSCLADHAGRTIAEVIEILPPEDESQRSDWSSG